MSVIWLIYCIKRIIATSDEPTTERKRRCLTGLELQLSGNSDNEENRLRLEREQNVVSIITIHINQKV